MHFRGVRRDHELDRKALPWERSAHELLLTMQHVAARILQRQPRSRALAGHALQPHLDRESQALAGERAVEQGLDRGGPRLVLHARRAGAALARGGLRFVGCEAVGRGIAVHEADPARNAWLARGPIVLDARILEW